MSVTIKFKTPHTSSKLVISRANLAARAPSLLDQVKDRFVQVLCENDNLSFLGPLRDMIEGNARDIVLRLVSHEHIYQIITIAQKIGVLHDVILESLEPYLALDHYAQMMGHESLYQIHLIAPECVDFYKFFKDCDDLGVKIVDIVNYTKLNFAEHIKMLMFFKTFDFAKCFGGNNEEIQARIAAMNKCRDNIGHKVFLVSPYDDVSYFNYAPTDLPAWKCDSVSIQQPPVVGKCMLAAREVMEHRLHDVTLDIFNKSPNPAVTTPFPFENVVFSGGLLCKIVSADSAINRAKQADVDLFIHARTFAERAKVFDRLIEWFDTSKTPRPRTFYAIIGSVVSIYMVGTNRKFQIIVGNATSAYGCVSRFDMTHVQFTYNGQLLATPEACIALRERASRLNEVPRLRNERIIKGMYSGFDIIKPAWDMTNDLNIDGLLNESDRFQLKKIIRGFHGFYYPAEYTADTITEENDALEHIAANIEKDSNAVLVTMSPIEVANNVTLGGNFDTTYESTLFTAFNKNILSINRHVGGRKVLLRTKFGVLRLNTKMMKVASSVVNDKGDFVISFAAPDDFKQFCDVLDTDVFTMIRRGQLATRLIHDGVVKFSLSRNQLALQMDKGYSCVQSQRGEPLSIEEDLLAGDDVQVIFTVTILTAWNDQRVVLNPIKFIKHQTTPTKKLDYFEPPMENIDEIAVATGELTYEDVL